MRKRLYSKELANEYIARHSGEVNDAFRLNYHFSPPIGWMNDPNGLVFYRGQYHLFYQYNPYGTEWGPMHWGHAVSDDLLSFTHCGVALAPDGKNESGCYSGGAVIGKIDRVASAPDGKNESGCYSGGAVDDKIGGEELILLYTKHKNGLIARERQGIAVSRDGVSFEKADKPILGVSDIPRRSSRSNFRDPKPVLIDGAYYVFVGSKSRGGKGQILVYSSADLREYSYFTTIGPYDFFGNMAECPDFVRLNGKDVLIFSSVGMPRKGGKSGNRRSCMYAVGKFDIEKRLFKPESFDEIDCGNDFYAAQTVTDDRGRTLIIAWMGTWDKTYFLHEQAHGWNGAFTIPRVLDYRDGRLIQTPLDELTAKRAALSDVRENFVFQSSDKRRFAPPVLSDIRANSVCNCSGAQAYQSAALSDIRASSVTDAPVPAKDLNLSDGTSSGEPLSGIRGAGYRERDSACENEKRDYASDAFCGASVPKSLDAVFVFNAAEGKNASVRIVNDGDDGDYAEFGLCGDKFFLDLSHAKFAPKDIRFSRDTYGKGVEVRMLLDVSSLELFLDGGRDTMTSLLFLGGEKIKLLIGNSVDCRELYEIRIR
ncbi:MAG: GH32 C-terminal domain-containing protein [Clostridiales bacterium]|jgi:beta-fructofuranosidase|nr:GH32 C-terminal domain-containing protein [Clostridiales bacterium]